MSESIKCEKCEREFYSFEAISLHSCSNRPVKSDEVLKLESQLTLSRQRVEELEAVLLDFHKNYDCQCVAGDYRTGAVHCRSCKAKEALEAVKGKS